MKKTLQTAVDIHPNYRFAQWALGCLSLLTLVCVVGCESLTDRSFDERMARQVGKARVESAEQEYAAAVARFQTTEQAYLKAVAAYQPGPDLDRAKAAVEAARKPVVAAHEQLQKVRFDAATEIARSKTNQNLKASVQALTTPAVTPPPTPAAVKPNSSLGKAESATKGGRPRIHNLGSEAILRFIPGGPLEIPILGQDLDDPESVVGVSMPAPLVADVDFFLSPRTNGSRLVVTILPKATMQMQTKDRLRLEVNITQRSQTDQQKAARATLTNYLRPGSKLTSQEASDAGIIAAEHYPPYSDVQLAALKRALLARVDDKERDEFSQNFQAAFNQSKAFSLEDRKPRGVLLASASRTFILYSEPDYRTSILNHQIDLQNITAFPLPQKETKQLFGQFVDQEFFALRLTLVNPTDKDQLVSLGMIKVYGRALVQPESTNNLGPAFTMPIEVAPQSLEHIYTMVQNGKSDLTREWIFRGLEFVGAMATVIAPASHAGMHLVEEVAIATGTGIPGLKTLFVDKVPNNLLNIVNFGMPDLIKVPKGGSINGKYLFFSKGKLQAVLQDPLMKYSAVELQGLKPSELSKSFAVPVVSLSFDTLQIPFENTTSSTESDTANKAADLKNRAGTLVSKLKDLQSNWTPTSGTFVGLTAGDYNLAVDKVDKLAGFDYSKIKIITNAPALVAALNTFKTNLASLNPSQINLNLLTANNGGMPRLISSIEQMLIVEQGLLQSKPATLYESTLAEAQKQITLAEAKYNLLAAVADAIVTTKIVAALNTAWQETSDQLKADDLNALQTALAEVNKLPKSPFGQ